MRKWWFRRLSALLIGCLLITALPALAEDAALPVVAEEAALPVVAEEAALAVFAEDAAQPEPAEGEAPSEETAAEDEAVSVDVPETGAEEPAPEEDADVAFADAPDDDVPEAGAADGAEGLIIETTEPEASELAEPDDPEDGAEEPVEDEEEIGDTQLMAGERAQVGYMAVAAGTVAYRDEALTESLGTFTGDSPVFAEAVLAGGDVLRVRFDIQEARDWAMDIPAAYVSAADALTLTDADSVALAAELEGDPRTRCVGEWLIPCVVFDADDYAFMAPAGGVSGLGVASHTQEQIQAFVDAHPSYVGQINIYSAAETASPYATGRLSAVNQQSALNMINRMRYIAGIDADVTLLTSMEERVAAASLVLRLNGKLSHSPDRPAALADEEYDALYSAGKSGAGSSNIAMGYTVTSAIPAYMSDNDANNISTVGHRRWILSPGMGRTIFGASGRFSAMYAHDMTGQGMQTKVAWPAQEMPIQYFSVNDPWSVSFGVKLDASAIEVDLVRVSDGARWHFSADSADGYFNVENSWYGRPGCVIFRPNNLKTLSPGDTFNVTITDSASNDTTRYTVRFFDLDLSGSQPLADVTGVTAIRCDDGVHLEWNGVTGADSYYVCRRKDSGNYQIIADVSGIGGYVDTGAPEGATYTYQIYAHTDSLTSKSAVATQARTLVPHTVTLNRTGSVSLYTTQKLQLTASIQPAGAITRLSWSSSNAKVARVDANGLVTPVKKGTAYITVSTDNGVTASVKVKVYNAPKPKKVKISPKGTVKLALGSKLKLSASLTPYYAATKLTWTSSNKRIARVSKYGTVTPLREGTVTITVRTSNGKTARMKVKVYDPYKPKKVSLSPSGTVVLKVGQSLQLNAILTPANARTKLTWITSNKNIARVYSNGLVVARKKGTVTITVRTKNGKKAQMKVRVVP